MRTYLVDEGAKLIIIGDEAEAAQGAPRGILDLYLPLVNVEDLDKPPRTSHSPRSVGEVTRVEHDHEHQNPRFR
jgi:hypothetical protein